ncbi:hypothetical protein [Marinibactrum halimedae]|uniref:Uncharacterized protein n=1 Tax=Marinibactrum halimedae TaxID=1444977 RepID=A0AA37T129_9GAMM|nr:hypothetical protein [Marinibactrum halimedae]MCD9458100.1 hypothetical protein [Marinibactrum halimedae]GLS25034.1 hypothetical protein GCM10007877_07480 [Marinibactrum halimedae]
MSWLLNCKIRSKLSQFDPMALLRLLRHNGYSLDHIFFSSNNSSVSQERLIEDVIISESRVDIVVNLGLLGAQSNLSNEWLKKLEESSECNRKSESVVRFLDHIIVSDFLAQVYPEINQHYFNSWKKIAQKHFQIENFDSEVTLHSLCKMLFPEFDVYVHNEESALVRKSKSLFVGNGVSSSEASMGGVISVEASVKRIELVQKTRIYQSNVDWEVEVSNRIKQYLLPLISGCQVLCEIHLFSLQPLNGFSLDSSGVLGRVPMGCSNLVTKSICFHKGLVAEDKMGMFEPHVRRQACRIQL